MKNKIISSIAFISLILSLNGCGFLHGTQGMPGVQGEQGEPGKDGVTPEFKVENGILYISYDNGKTWKSLGNVSGSDGATGEPGEDGVDGEPGKDGVTPEFKVENGILYVSYDNGKTWKSLGNVSGADGAAGEPGEDGIDGEPGKDGVTPGFKVENGTLYVTYNNGVTWTSLGNVSGSDGETGEEVLSAYEIFLKYHPEYTGSEEDWINDVAMGNVCNLFGHEWDEGVVTTEPTKGVDGEKTYSCANCDEHKYEVLPKIEVTDAEIYEVNGIKYVNYGSYPQTHVGDAALISELNKLNETNSRGYYEYNGKEYAKVSEVYTYYYGSYTDDYGETQYHKYSDGSTIYRNTTEWFNVEPIKWRIISENGDGSYQLYSEYLLDITSYCDYQYFRRINNVEIYQNNYKYSNIRAWLNGYNGTEYKVSDYTNKGFYDVAFKDNEKGAIVTTEVDNSVSTTDSASNPYACENTFDKIYLLSYKDLYNSNYGFTDNKSRYAQVTDYVKANGAYWSIITRYLNNGSYWLRSPDDSGSTHALCVRYDGDVDLISGVLNTYGEVRVACNLNLE